MTDLFSLTGRSALVTGGGSGIGCMIARGLLMAGARVIVTARTTEKVEMAASELRQFGDCIPVTAELGSVTGRESLADDVLRLAPDLSILVNNAGTTEYAAFSDYTPEQWHRVFEVNTAAPFFMSQLLMPLLCASASAVRPSQIINISSSAGIVPHVGTIAAYGPSKAALQHITRSMGRDFAPMHVHVNAIAPGPFLSGLTEPLLTDPSAIEAFVANVPAGRIGDADDMAALAVAIACSRYMVGQVISLDGGQALEA
ncbi:SDR family NAD(P)-dependent oxidoreductase [Novosphingobium cyanobacteriorum]|uniref:SDR family NAD(P)-dependent oxidoreductase n=1 Tax=Novosphingobium cyanobacteriorum TaxID=3024215 RepID=UPI0023F9C660|nr:SDR family NAD(P)-dependent oxidoreductase [Novosphingobium cyanobacteriorum]